METIQLSGQRASKHQIGVETDNHKLGQILRVLFQHLLKQYRLKKDLYHLLSLEDRMLKDIGVSRGEVKMMLKGTSITFFDRVPPFFVRILKMINFKTLFQLY